MPAWLARSSARPPEQAASAAQNYDQAVPLAGDVADAAQGERMFAELPARDIWLDGLVNNAGDCSSGWLQPNGLAAPVA